MNDPDVLHDMSSRLQSVTEELHKKIIGQSNIIRYILAAILAGGHVLLEDVPGTGKTTLATSLAHVLGLDFSRVQGTPDLLPSELTGNLVFHPSTGKFEFRKGPVFTQLLLMDEINRATPRTQSALLEAMAESHVTIDGQTHELSRPFFVIATANPIESQGVFPLPEAQLDRFLVRLKLGYTEENEEMEMVRRIRLHDPVKLVTRMHAEDVLQAQTITRNITVVDDVLRYIVRLCRATREQEGFILGASPRSVLLLTSFAQAIALLSGRSYVTPDDVQDAWIPVMRHRIHAEVSWAPNSTLNEVEKMLSDILTRVPVPTELAGEEDV